MQFPLKEVFLEDDDEPCLCPHTRLCCECRGGLHKGLPYMLPDEQVVPMCLADSDFNNSTKMIIDIALGKIAGEDIVGIDHVETHNEHGDSSIACYDGYTPEQWAGLGKKPTDPKKVVKSTIVHPRTNELQEVYWSQGTPAFRWEVRRTDAARHATNAMPHQVYAAQPRATFDHWSWHLESANADVPEPPAARELRGGVSTGIGQLYPPGQWALRSLAKSLRLLRLQFAWACRKLRLS